MRPDNKPIHIPFFVPILGCLIIGISFGNAVNDPIYLFFILVLSSGLYGFKKIPARYFFYLICLIWGAFSIQSQLADPSSENHIIYLSDGKKYTITGKVVSSALQSFQKTGLVIDALSVTHKNNTKTPVTGRMALNIYGPLSREIRYNDVITFDVSLKPFRNFSNPGGFNYEKYMRLQNIRSGAWTHSKSLVVHPETQPSCLTQGILAIQQFREAYTRFVKDTLESEGTSSILSALVVGRKDLISAELRDMFSKTGASHILAISGLHLSIIALVVYFLFYAVFSRSGRLLISGRASKISSLLTLGPLLFYAFLSGFSPSTQRAMIMIAMVMLARTIDRDNDVVNTLALAGILILLSDAGALFSISFQLSFAAVSFIIAGLSVINEHEWIDLNSIKGRFIMFIGVSVFAGLGTFPLIVHYFNLISFSQTLTNLVVIPLIGFVVLPAGIVSLVFFSFSNVISAGIIHLSGMILNFCIMVIEKISLIGFSWCRMGTLSLFELVLIYSLFSALYLYLKGHVKISRILFVPVLLLMCLDTGYWVHQRFYNKDLLVTVLDVGQGNCALVTAPHGRQILIDGGGFSYDGPFDTGRHLVAPFLWQNKILSLDAVILTHPDSDHMNGLLFILQNFNVGQFIKNADASDSPIYQALISTASERRIPVKTIGSGSDSLTFDQAVFQFFSEKTNPNPAETGKSDVNDHSMVCKIRFKNFSMLFPGDILKTREKDLVLQYGQHLPSDVLLSPHHGSKSSSSDFFLEKVNPESVIISCGWQNRYRFPHESILDRYQKKHFQVFRTDMDGAIRISTSGNGYNILTLKGS